MEQSLSSIYKVFDGPDTIEQAAPPWDDVVREDYHVIVYRDRYPVTPGHLLFVPKYNSIGVLNDAFEDAVRHGRQQVKEGNWDAYNIGINMGQAAGQTINWPHIHLIPRRNGDVEDPIGGVRNTIPGKGNYRSPNYRKD